MGHPVHCTNAYMNTNTLEYIYLLSPSIMCIEWKSQLANTYLRVVCFFFVDLKLAFYRSVLERLTQV